MKLYILICVVCFLFGMAVGAWVLELIARKSDVSRLVATDRLRERAERAAFERGYASALEVKAAIEDPADHERSAR